MKSLQIQSQTFSLQTPEKGLQTPLSINGLQIPHDQHMDPYGTVYTLCWHSIDPCGLQMVFSEIQQSLNTQRGCIYCDVGFIDGVLQTATSIYMYEVKNELCLCWFFLNRNLQFNTISHTQHNTPVHQRNVSSWTIKPIMQQNQWTFQQPTFLHTTLV